MFTIKATDGHLGDRVRITSYGGKIPAFWCGHTGVIVSFTRAGNPVIRRASHDGFAVDGVDIRTDTYGCARLVRADGSFIRPGDDDDPSSATNLAARICSRPPAAPFGTAAFRG